MYDDLMDWFGPWGSVVVILGAVCIAVVLFAIIDAWDDDR